MTNPGHVEVVDGFLMGFVWVDSPDLRMFWGQPGTHPKNCNSFLKPLAEVYIS